MFKPNFLKKQKNSADEAVDKKPEKKQKIESPKEKYLKDNKADLTKRLLAWGIDMTVIGAIATALSQALGNDFQDFFFGPVFCYMVSSFIYSSAMEGSKKQATLGKKLLGMKVIRTDGMPISYPQSMLRNAARILFIGTSGFSYVLAIFNKQGAALHDICAFTRVVSIETRVPQEKINWRPLKRSGWIMPVAGWILTILTMSVVLPAPVRMAMARHSVNLAYAEAKEYQDKVVYEYRKTGKFPESVALPGRSDDNLNPESTNILSYNPGKGEFSMYILGHPGNMNIFYSPKEQQKTGKSYDAWACEGRENFLPVLIPAECAPMVFISKINNKIAGR